MFLPGARKVFIIIFCKNILLDIFQFINHCGGFSLCSFLTIVQKKVSLEKEAKVSILEAGIADVSTHFTFRFWFEAKMWQECQTQMKCMKVHSLPTASKNVFPGCSMQTLFTTKPCALVQKNA